jgi:TolB-like protein
LLIIFTLLLFVSMSPAIAAPARVAILPFDINAEKDMTFLQEGIMDMLGSRLAWQDKVEVISKNETKAALASVEGFGGESRALLVGGKLQADYVLFGSLTVFGESVSIDAKMADVSGQQPPLPFFAQTRGMGEVIPQINQFASNINATVFGREVAQRPAAAPAAQAGALAATATQPPPPGYDPRMHPEKLLQSGVQSETQVPVAGQPYQTPNPAFVATAGAGASAGGPTFWKSRSFKTLITGLAVADVDNDDRMELVVVSDTQVSIYRMENGRLIKQALAAETSQSSTYISVDAADLNGNGTPELYISSLGSGNTVVDSFVLEYSGGAYKTISGNDNWYYRVANTPDKGKVLLGQRQRFNAESIFLEPILEMNWQGDRIEPGRQVLPGGKTNLMGLAFGDITHTGSSVVAAYNDWDRVRIYSASGETIWEDSDRSGGDKLFFNLPKIDAGQPNRQYYPLRIRIADIDRDGKEEVLIARHDELTNSVLKDFRLFKKAKIASMVWNGLGLVPQWETPSLFGRISEFTVGDIDNDGQDELVIALVSKEGDFIFTDSISIIITFNLNVK